MAKPYPKEDHLIGNFAPLRMESNVDDLIIEGNLPTEINGSYVQQSTRTDNGSWVFDWVAPSSDFGEITFSGSGLATGGNSGTGGDHVFVTSTSVKKAQYVYPCSPAQ